MSTEPRDPARSCQACGQAMPPVDLEAEAGAVDHALSFELGRLVDRWAWAAGQPDGLMENVLGWLPGEIDRRAVWRRGQELWAARLRADGLAHCASCRPPLPAESA